MVLGFYDDMSDDFSTAYKFAVVGSVIYSGTRGQPPGMIIRFGGMGDIWDPF